MTYARADLIRESLACLGIFTQADNHTARPATELVDEVLGCLGLVRQADTSGLYTRDDLVSRAAEALGVLQQGQVLSTEDHDKIDSFVNPVVADLRTRVVVTVANIDTPGGVIPGGILDNLAVVLANAARGFYETVDGSTLPARAQTAEARLQNFTDGSQITEKLQSIASDLAARGIIVIDIAGGGGIPFSYFPTLADVVAYSCMEKFRVGPELAGRLAAKAARAEVVLTNLGRAFVVDRNLDAILAEVASDDLVAILDTSDIPFDWFRPLSQIVADAVKSNFVLPPDVTQRVMMEASDARDRLRRTTRGRATRLRAPMDFF